MILHCPDEFDLGFYDIKCRNNYFCLKLHPAFFLNPNILGRKCIQLYFSLALSAHHLPAGSVSRVAG